MKTCFHFKSFIINTTYLLAFIGQLYKFTLKTAFTFVRHGNGERHARIYGYISSK